MPRTGYPEWPAAYGRRTSCVKTRSGSGVRPPPAIHTMPAMGKGRDILYTAGLTLASPVWGWKLLRTGKWKTDWSARMGRGDGLAALPDKPKRPPLTRWPVEVTCSSMPTPPRP